MVTELERNLAQRITVGDIFRRHARHAPEKIALIEERGGKEHRLTYREFNARINQFANALVDFNFKKGDRVAFICLNSIEFMVGLFGCAKAGVEVVPLNPGMTPDDIEYMINQSEASAVMADDIFSALVEGVKGKCPGLKDFICVPLFGVDVPEYFTFYDDFIAGRSEAEVEVVIWERDNFGVYYTSGTTSRPKGTVLSHLTMYMMSMTNAIEYGLGRSPASAMVLPAFHGAQHCINLVVFLMEGKMIVTRALDPKQLCGYIQNEKITFLLLLPLLWRALLDYPEKTEFDLSSLKLGIYAMAPMDKPTLRSLIETFTPNFYLATGQTEFIPSSENFAPEWQLIKEGNYWGTPAIGVETVIMDDQGNILPRGEVGEIVRRGPGTLTEYLKNPEATDEKLKFGWAHSEDIGSYDEDDLLRFVDRKKDMIKTGGENVPSIKVEQVVLAHPRVSEVAVVGLPHARWAEAITAFVVLTPGPEIEPAEVMAHCKKELGKFEVPKKIIICEQLPKTTTGKLQKNVLKEEHQAMYEGEQA